MAVAVLNTSPHENLARAAQAKGQTRGFIISSLSSFQELFRCVSPRAGCGRNEVAPDVVVVVNQNAGFGRRAIRGGMRILRHGDVVAPADAILERGIDSNRWRSRR